MLADRPSQREAGGSRRLTPRPPAAQRPPAARRTPRTARDNRTPRSKADVADKAVLDVTSRWVLSAQQALEAARRKLAARTDLRNLFDLVHSQPAWNGGNLFWVCDERGTGRISLRDVEKSLATLGLRLASDTRQYLLDAFDPTGKGFVQYETIYCALHDPSTTEATDLEAAVQSAMQAVQGSAPASAWKVAAPAPASFLPPIKLADRLAAPAIGLQQSHDSIVSYEATYERVMAAATEDDDGMEEVLRAHGRYEAKHEHGMAAAPQDGSVFGHVDIKSRKAYDEDAVHTALRFYRAAEETRERTKRGPLPFEEIHIDPPADSGYDVPFLAWEHVQGGEASRARGASKLAILTWPLGVVCKDESRRQQYADRYGLGAPPWQWEDGHPWDPTLKKWVFVDTSWRDFHQEECEILHEGMLEGKQTVVVRMGPPNGKKVPYIVDLLNMVQVKVATGYMRRIRYMPGEEVKKPPNVPLHQPKETAGERHEHDAAALASAQQQRLEATARAGEDESSDSTALKDRRAVYHPLHVLLIRAGWSVLVYDSVEDDDGSEAAAQLRAVFSYVSAHRSFRYCQVLLMTEGIAAGGVFRALAEHPETFASQLKCIAASQPEVFSDASATDALLGQWVPACNVPVLVALARGATATSKYMARYVHAALKPELKLAAINRDLYWVQRGFPLYGQARNQGSHSARTHDCARKLFHSAYFAQHPEQLMHFVESATKPKRKAKRENGRLTIKHIAAFEIPNADAGAGFGGTSDPYVSFRVWIDGKMVAQADTPPIQNAYECQWGDFMLLVEVNPKWTTAKIEVLLWDEDVTNNDDQLGSHSTTIHNHGGKCGGAFDRLRLEGHEGFDDSFVSFEWEYSDPTPDARMLWHRGAFSHAAPFFFSSEHNIGQQLLRRR